ncbi:hypothetical protein Bbelb_074670 [Branchiostoma belcheri]|nr:hypothetical protein Bbelb_074670 [Branchiostoma belcheri]
MSHSELSTVVGEFHGLDFIFQSGSDLDVVERGYARKLVHAISTQNVVLECEALKGLGDLYMHKAKMKKHKAENFHKACSLYTELLRYYTSIEEKQVVQHRIRYAEKCTKLVYEQGIAKTRGTDSGNTILAVSMTLHEVKTRLKEYGTYTVPLIEGYTNSLVKAIVEGNKRLEVESLKSLGDVYLEKGRVGKDETAFSKSAGLYRAALDRCEDSDGRETLRHRIKYAERVKEKERKKAWKRLETGPNRSKKVGNSSGEKQDVSDSTYQDHLQEGCRALQTGDLDTAERNFAAALRAVHVKGQHSEEAEPLCKLSDVYLKRGEKSKDGGDFTKAAALSNAALVRAKTEHREGIRHTIQEITQSFVQHVLSIEQTVPTDDVEKHKSVLTEYRCYVEKEIKRIEQQIDPYSLDDNDPEIMEVEKKRVEANKALFDTVAHQRRTLISGLVDESIEVMGPPPCKYAMIGLGSQATGLVTPYSDLEFAILIEKETENSLEYFQNLTHYLHLKVINLGETILPAMAIKSLNDFESKDKLDSWFYDSPTTIWETIQAMYKKGAISDENAHHLMVLVSISAELRLRTYMNNGGQVENMSVLSSMSVNDDIEEKAKRIFHFSNVKQLMRYYYTATPLKYFVPQLSNGQPVEEPSILFDNSLMLQADVYESVCDYNQSKICLEQALQTAELSTHGTDAIHPDIAELLYKLGNAWDNLGDHRKAVTYHQQSLQMKRSIYGEGKAHHNIASSLNDLGAAWSRLGDHRKAVSYYEQALEMMRSIYGEGNAHPDIASTFNNLGAAWSRLGDYRKAASYYEQALEMKQSIYGEGNAHPDIASSLNNLGVAWSDLGDYRKAVSYYEQALEMEQSIYGEGNAHPDIASTFYNLGVAWSRLGDYRKAVSYYEQALEMEQSIYGEGNAHPDIASTFYNLGVAWSRLGDYRKAVSYYEQALEMEQSIYGEGNAHPDIAKSLNNLGNTWSNLGDHRKAVSYHEQALEMMRSIYGEGNAHPDIASSLNNLGNTWSNLGDHRKAVSYHEQALEMMRSIYGEGNAHPDIASSLNNLGNTWSNLGDHRKAVSYHEQALEMMRSIYGEGNAHPDIASSLNNLGNAWSDLGDYRKTVSYHEQALEMRRSIYGEGNAHPDIASSLNNLGAAWSDLGDYRKTVSYHEQALEMMRSIYGEGNAHPDIASSLNNLSNAWRNLGDHRKAVSYHEQTLEMMRSIYGEGNAHPDIAGSLNNLGAAWSDLGDHRKAVSYHEQALEMRRSIYGEDSAHPDIANSLRNLCVVWRDLGDHRKAASYYAQFMRIKQMIDETYRP